MWNLGFINSVFIILFNFSLIGPLSGTLSVSNQHDKGWLRIHNIKREDSKVQHYEVEADKCPHGSWLSESLPGGCVCLNGLWALSQGWCDEDYYLAYGKGHCFKFGKSIQKLAFLGDPSNPFEPTNFITKENGHVFRSFSNEILMPFEFSRDTNRTILLLKPGKGTRVILEVHPDDWKEHNSQIYNDGNLEGEPVCFDTDMNMNWSEEMLMIYKVRNGIKYINVTDQCPTSIFYDGLNLKLESSVFKVLPGQAIHMKSGKMFKASDNCPSSRQSSANSFPLHRPNTIRHKRSTSSDPPSASAAVRLDRVFSEQEKDEMVNTANLRVAKLELNWLLQKVRPPTFYSQEWKIVRKLKDIFTKVCPEGEAPKFLVNAMVRLFRLFYLHTKDFYPKGHTLEEFKQYERIHNVLDECFSAAQNYTFYFRRTKDTSRVSECHDMSNVETLGNGTEVNQTTTYCPCKMDLGSVITMYPLNLTAPPSEQNITKSNISIAEPFALPGQDEFNGTFHDIPTETVWKIINFGHYYCAKHFRFFPVDHSAMITKLEDFFNEDIIYRWKRPGSNSNQIWENLYSTFNLKKFATSVDLCVGGAKFLSEYPEWLSRPTIEVRRRRKRSLQREEVGTGSAYCLEDAWDPVDKLGVSVPAKCADFKKV